MGKLTFALLASALGALGMAACSSFTEADPTAPADEGGTPDAFALAPEASVDGAAATSTYEAIVMRDRPLHYFRFGDVAPNVQLLDLGTAAGLSATYSGAVMPGASPIVLDPADTSLAIDGNGCVASTGDSGVDVAANLFTLEAWIYPTAAGASGGIISDRSGAVVPAGYVLELLETGYLTMTLYSAPPTNPQVLTSMKKAEANAWKHVVLVATPSRLDFYLDGLHDATLSVTSAGQPASRLAIGSNNGCDVSDPAAAYFQNGRIDEVALYDTALGETQIAEHFAEGTRTR